MYIPVEDKVVRGIGVVQGAHRLLNQFGDDSVRGHGDCVLRGSDRLMGVRALFSAAGAGLARVFQISSERPLPGTVPQGGGLGLPAAVGLQTTSVGESATAGQVRQADGLTMQQQRCKAMIEALREREVWLDQACLQHRQQLRELTWRSSQSGDFGAVPDQDTDWACAVLRPAADGVSLQACGDARASDRHARGGAVLDAALTKMRRRLHFLTQDHWRISLTRMALEAGFQRMQAGELNNRNARKAVE